MINLTELETALEEVTHSAPVHGFFLEYSRDREKSYSMRSTRRWLDVVAIIEKKKLHGKCLDIGTSPFTFALSNLNVFTDIETLDYTNAFQERCATAGIRLYVGGDDWEKNALLPDDYYDCIIFLEVIEHMHMNPEKVLLFLKKKLRNGGHLIMSTPNLMCFGNRIKMLLNKKLSQFSYPAFSENEHPAHGHGHDRVFIPSEMKEYLTNTGWTSFTIGYHSIEATDDDISNSKIQRFLRIPIRILKHVDPSMRQIMLITAKR